MGRHLYILQSKVTGTVKVGRSDNPDRRLHDLQVGSPHILKVILIARDCGHLEGAVHRAMYPHRTRHINGEWFHEEGLGSVPEAIWEQALPWYMENPDWWRR